MAVLGDRVFMVTDNAHLFALHRFTGQLIWDVEMADSRQNYGATCAPLVVERPRDRGRLRRRRGRPRLPRRLQGRDRRARLALLDHSGAAASRARKPGTAARSSTAAAPPGSPAPTIPKRDLLYWPTGNPCPDYNGDERKGDNLYTASCWRSIPPPAS